MTVSYRQAKRVDAERVLGLVREKYGGNCATRKTSWRITKSGRRVAIPLPVSPAGSN
jgi:hypothetical protein